MVPQVNRRHITDGDDAGNAVLLQVPLAHRAGGAQVQVLSDSDNVGVLVVPAVVYPAPAAAAPFLEHSHQIILPNHDRRFEYGTTNNLNKKAK